MNTPTESKRAEVVVVGAGPAGLSAALAATQAGAQVNEADAAAEGQARVQEGHEG